MKKGKRILSAIALIVLSLGGGYLIGFTGWLDPLVDSFRSVAGFRVLLDFFMAYLLSIVVHELGHFVFGLATGYRFLSFRILSLTLEKQTDGTLKFKRRRVPGTLGQCLMTPSDDKSLPVFWYNFGGVFFNLVVFLLSFLCWGFSVTPEIEVWWFSMTVLSALTAFGNWFPLKYVSNDGNNYRDIKRDPVSRDIFDLILRLSLEISHDRPITELELSIDPAPLSYDKPIQASYKGMHLMKTLYELRFDAFATLIQEAQTHFETRKDPRANGMKVLFHFVGLLRYGSAAVAFKDKMTANVIKMARRDSVIQMVAYYEALLTNDPKTEAIKARFLQACLKAPYPSEAKAVMRVARHLEEAVSSNRPLLEAEPAPSVPMTESDPVVTDGESAKTP